MLMVGLATPALTLESAGILCQTAAGANSGEPQSPAGNTSADCCILGCSMFGPPLAPPPPFAVLLPSRSWNGTEPQGRPLLVGSGLGSSTSQARAPPSQA